MLAEIRTGCSWVAEQASLVVIDHERVAGYAREFNPQNFVDPIDQPPPADAGPEEPRAALVIALDAINFGSGYHPHVRKRAGRSGSVTMAMALRAWAAVGPIASARLLELTTAEAHVIFDQPKDDDSCAELMGLFTAALNDLGHFVQTGFGGSFLALIESVGRSSDELVTTLDRLSFYRDVASYRGRVVPFYKRAQVTAADLAREFRGAGPGAFDDLDQLTAFADNLVPHVLRVDGLLRYDDDLAATIDSGEPVRAGSQAEVEIRAAGVHAVELLREALADQGHIVRSSRIDEVLWLRGGAARYKAIPRHRTRSVFY